MLQEYRFPDGTRADCISATHAIEVDFSEKWAEAIGQALHYALWMAELLGVGPEEGGHHPDLPAPAPLICLPSRSNFSLDRLAPKLDSGRILAVVSSGIFLDLTGRDLHDVDGVADYISGALLAFGVWGARSDRPEIV